MLGSSDFEFAKKRHKRPDTYSCYPIALLVVNIVVRTRFQSVSHIAYNKYFCHVYWNNFDSGAAQRLPTHVRFYVLPTPKFEYSNAWRLSSTQGTVHSMFCTRLLLHIRDVFQSPRNSARSSALSSGLPSVSASIPSFEMREITSSMQGSRGRIWTYASRWYEITHTHEEW